MRASGSRRFSGWPGADAVRFQTLFVVLVLVLVLVMVPFLVAADVVDVELRADAPAVSTPRGALVHGFAFLPRGFWAEGQDCVRLETAAGAGLVCEVRPTGRYPDDSVRACRLSALVPKVLARSGTRLKLVRVAAGAAGSSEGLKVRQDAGSVTMDAGAVSITLSSSGEDLIPSIAGSIGGRKLELRDDRPAKLSLAGEWGRWTDDGSMLRVVRVERLGPLAGVCRVAGFLVDDEETPRASYSLRMTLHAGSPLIDVVAEVEFLQDGGMCEDLALVIPVRRRVHRRVRVLGGGGAESAPGSEPVVVAALDGARVLCYRGDETSPVDPGVRSGVLLRAGGGAPSIGLVVSRLRPNAPRSVRAADGSLSVYLHDGPLLVEAQTLRAELCLAVGAAAALAKAERSLTAESRPALRSLEHAAAALQFERPLQVGVPDVREDPMPRLLGVVARGIERTAGHRDYGDYRYRDGFANLEYDPARAVLLRALATGDATQWIRARDMLHHWVACDRSKGESGIPAGFPFMHGLEHRSHTYEAGHVWSGGLVLGILVTGDPAWTRAAHELKKALLEVSNDAFAFSKERCYGWMLLAIEDLLLLGPDHALQEARQRITTRLESRQDGRGWFAIDRDGGDGRGGFAVTPWVTAGITMEALYRVGRHQELLRAARFLAIDARYEDGAMARRVLYGKELEGGIGRHGVLGPLDELMIAAGLGRALAVREDAVLRTVFEEVLVRSCNGLARGRYLTPNQAARALVAIRSLSDTVGKVGRTTAASAGQ